MSETVAILNAYARNLEAERDALRARVAKLEAALQCIYDITEDVGLERIARAALKDAPQ